MRTEASDVALQVNETRVVASMVRFPGSGLSCRLVFDNSLGPVTCP